MSSTTYIERMLTRYNAKASDQVVLAPANSRPRPPRAPNPSRLMVPRNCIVCGAEFLTRKDKLSQGRGKFCSKECLRLDFSRRPGLAGPANPNWKGGVSKTTRYADRFEARYPKKVAAQRAVAKAVKSGRLKLEPCETCGSNEKIHGHHDDYSKPLKVRWLCQGCHIAHHAKMRRKKV